MAENIAVKLSEADASYKSFPDFKIWCEGNPDLDRWDNHRDYITGIRKDKNIDFDKAFNIVSKTAAIETGAIDDLYQTGGGITYDVVFTPGNWDKLFGSESESVVSMFNSHLAAYEMVLDFATQDRPMDQDWIRDLHRKICGSIKSYQVLTDSGVQEKKLKHGDYKDSPNHLKKADGSFHPFCPVVRVTEEMNELVKILNSAVFTKSHPLLQSSYAHYCLLAIHPFPAGNGLVARALSSIYLVRDVHVPLLIMADEKTAYFDALAAADNGFYEDMIYFTLEHAINAVTLAKESIASTNLPEINDMIEGIERAYRSRGGYMHTELDAVSYIYFDRFVDAVKKRVSSEVSKIKDLNFLTATDKTAYDVTDEGMRAPVQDGCRKVAFELNSDKPERIECKTVYALEVPKDAGKFENICLRNQDDNSCFEMPIRFLLPSETTNFEIQLSLFVDTATRKLIQLFNEAANTYRSKAGY